MDIKKLTELRDYYLENVGVLSQATLDSLEQDFELEFHHNSTKIEGNTLTIFEVKTILEDGISVGGKSLREIYEVVNNKKAYKYVKCLVDEGQELAEEEIKKRS